MYVKSILAKLYYSGAMGNKNEGLAFFIGLFKNIANKLLFYFLVKSTGNFVQQ